MNIEKGHKVLSLVCALFVSFLFLGWGGTGHAIINQSGIQYLPESMTGMIQQKQLIASLASAADNRKSLDPIESPKHFMDIDAYAEFASKSVPQDYDSLVARYSSTTVLANGILPWAIKIAYDSLIAEFNRKDWTRAWSTTADLGHYIGDAHMPLHVTRWYGSGSLNSSIPPWSSLASKDVHSRYESDMVNSNKKLLTIVKDSVYFIEVPLQTAFQMIYHSYRYVDSIYAADSIARAVSGWNGIKPVPTTYVSELWNRTGGFTNEQMNLASHMLSNYVYTAWIRAGSPSLPIVSQVAEENVKPMQIQLYQNYPNPFNPSTKITFFLPQESIVTLKVYDMLGHEAAALVNTSLISGNYEVLLNTAAFHMSSGVYFYQLVALEQSSLKWHTFTRKLLFLK